jgi:hypothetical protein
MATSSRHYESAFEDFLGRRGIAYVAVDQAHKAAFGGVRLKSFDYILYPSKGPALLADVKGRKLGGRTGQLPGQTWVTLEDIKGLGQWEAVFGEGYLAVFVFAYWLAGDGEGVSRAQSSDPELVHHCEGRGYSFWVAQLAGYRTCMKRRSKAWQTVYVPRRLFRHWAMPFNHYLGVRPGRGRESGCDRPWGPSQ